jgi:hypothetical protein
MSTERRSPPPPDDETFSAWPLLIAIGSVKLITLITILVFAWGRESTTLIASTLLPWIGAIAALLAAPLAWQLRKRRVRRRRAALLAAEFMEPCSTPNTKTTRTRPGLASQVVPNPSLGRVDDA